MSSAQDLRELEALCPFAEDDFRADLAALADSTADASRSYAADARRIARLARRVPRCPFDETGSTPWTSFRRELALARKTSDRAAAAQIRIALRLTSALPCALALLDSGVLTVPRALAFATELEQHSDELAAEVDAALADKAALLPTWRIEQEVRRAVLRLDPDAAAQRVASKNADRGVDLTPDSDDQAAAYLHGPAVPLQRWYDTLDIRARALRAAGDPRTLDALRFDLATSAFPCATHPPSDPDGSVPTGAAAPDRPAGQAGQPDESHGSDALGAAGLRASGLNAAPTDCRRTRPVQALVVVPVETGLGLSNDPGWLEGYGWISAPTCRQLLVDAELRRVCAQAGTGLLVDVDPHDRRPPPTPTGVRDSLLGMVLDDVVLSDVGWRTEPRHDPSDRLRDYVSLRDRFCDGPTGARVPARRAELDHDLPWPTGPTAAWNLAARSTRTHQHKHRGWTALRTPTGTLWISPAGQIAEVPRHVDRPPGIDADLDGLPAVLPDPDDLARTDRRQATPPADFPPWLPADSDTTTWTWLPTDEPVPF